MFEFLVFARFDVYARTHTAAAAAVNAGPPRRLIIDICHGRWSLRYGR